MTARLRIARWQATVALRRDRGVVPDQFTSRWPSEPIASADHGAGQRVLIWRAVTAPRLEYLASRGALRCYGRSVLETRRARRGDRIQRTALGIRYVHGDATTTDWWDGVAFDGVLCNMALMDSMISTLRSPPCRRC